MTNPIEITLSVVAGILIVKGGMFLWQKKQRVSGSLYDCAGLGSSL